MSIDKIVLQTPIARTRYSHLSKPDTKWNSEGEYKTELVLEKNTEETKAFVKSVEEAARAYYGADAAKAMLPLKTDAETGELIFKAKSSFNLSLLTVMVSYYARPTYQTSSVVLKSECL